MARQQRVLYRDDPPKAHFLVDITSLRMPGHFRTAQLRHLLETAQLPNVTIQVVPVCWHSGMSGGFILTDGAAYAEAVHAGQVYGGDDETPRRMRGHSPRIRVALPGRRRTGLTRPMV